MDSIAACVSSSSFSHPACSSFVQFWFRESFTVDFSLFFFFLNFLITQWIISFELMSQDLHLSFLCSLRKHSCLLSIDFTTVSAQWKVASKVIDVVSLIGYIDMEVRRVFQGIWKIERGDRGRWLIQILFLNTDIHVLSPLPADKVLEIHPWWCQVHGTQCLETICQFIMKF